VLALALGKGSVSGSLCRLLCGVLSVALGKACLFAECQGQHTRQRNYTGAHVLVLSAFRPRGVPGPTSKLSLRVPAQMGRREMEHKGEQKREPRLVLSCTQGGCACIRGLQAFARERERERERESESLSISPFSRAATTCTRALDLPFIDVRRRPRCTMGSVAMC
jgi:hypothetical protein